MGNKESKKKSKEHRCDKVCFKQLKPKEFECEWHPCKPFRWEYTEKHHIALKQLSSSHKTLNGLTDDILEIIKSYIFNIILTEKKQKRYYKRIRSNIYTDDMNESNIKLCNDFFHRYGTSDESIDFKLALLGESGVGKEALCEIICYGYWHDEYEYNPVMEDAYRKPISFENTKFMIDMLNQPGNDEFQGMVDCMIRQADAIWLCFDVMRKKTFDHCCNLLKRLISIKENDPFCVIFVGCKNDNRFEESYSDSYSNDIEIESFDIMKQIESFGDIPYIEISSKKMKNIENILHLSVYEYWIQCKAKVIDWNDVLDRFS